MQNTKGYTEFYIFYGKVESLNLSLIKLNYKYGQRSILKQFTTLRSPRSQALGLLEYTVDTPCRFEAFCHLWKICYGQCLVRQDIFLTSCFVQITQNFLCGMKHIKPFVFWPNSSNALCSEEPRECLSSICRISAILFHHPENARIHDTFYILFMVLLV